MRKKEVYDKLMIILDRHSCMARKFNLRRFWMRIMFWTNNYDRMLHYIADIEKRNIRSREQIQIEVYCWKGTVYYILKDYINASTAFEEAEKLDGHSSEIRYFLAKCYFELLEIEKAETYYRNLMTDAELKYLGYYGYGCCMFKKQRFDEALSFINRAIDSSNSLYRVDMVNKKGLCLMEQGKLEEALSCFENCLALSPNIRHIRMNIALTLSKLGRHEIASEYYKDLLNKFPYDIITINNLSLCLGAQGKYMEALKYCDLGLKIDPLNADLLSNKGCMLFYLGDFNNALECIYEAEQILKGDSGLLNNKALCLMHLDRSQEALEIFDQLLSHGHNSKDFILNRAFCLFKNQRFDEALSCLANIDGANNELRDIYTLQSLCFEQLGDNVKAVELLNKALVIAG